MKENGLEIRLSAAGKIASELIATLGGLPSVHLIAHEDLIRTFGSLAHARFETTVIDEATNNKKSTLLGRSLSRNRLTGLLLKSNWNNILAAENHLKALIEMGALQLGMQVQCQHCTQHNWFPLDGLNARLHCERCLKQFDFPTSSPPSDAWHYRATGPFAIEGYAQGGFCVALSLSRLLDGHWMTATWIPNFNITKAGKHFYEADFGIFLRDDSAFNRGNNVYLIVGECKSFDRFEPRDFKRMRDLAKAFPGATLVFSTFRKELTGFEKRVIAKIADRGRRPLGGNRWENPVMVLTGLELFSRERLPYCWKAAAPPYNNFWNAPLSPDFIQSVCDITQQIHLGMEPHTKWFEKWRTTREAKRLDRATPQAAPNPSTPAIQDDTAEPE
jgi:hypothetical protein